MSILNTTYDLTFPPGLTTLILIISILTLIFRYSTTSSTSSTQPIPKSIGHTRVPQSPSLPLIGNIWQLSLKEPLTSTYRLARKYKECYRLDLPGVGSLVTINSHRLYHEICSQRRFHKEPAGAIKEARGGAGDGLFTAFTDEESWEVAHRILMPVFAKDKVEDLVDDTLITTQILIDRWTKMGPNTTLDPVNELSRLSLDSIAHCAFDLNLNSLHTPEIHPFAPKMTFFLGESGKRAMRPSWMNTYLLRSQNAQYESAIETLHSTSWSAIHARRAAEANGAPRKHDILDAMLHEVDPKTGKPMTELNCMYNTLAILGAGYETTACTLAWTLMMLLTHPDCLARVRDELNAVIGSDPDTDMLSPISKDHLKALPYLTACIRETLRLYPVAPSHALKLREDALPSSSSSRSSSARGLGPEDYLIHRDDTVRINLFAIQRDPTVWGADANSFRPERMLDSEFAKLPRNAWKPFGNGVRICLGRHMAMVQITVMLASVIGAFDFQVVDGRCEARVGEGATLFPDGCAVRVERRRR